MSRCPAGRAWPTFARGAVSLRPSFSASDPRVEHARLHGARDDRRPPGPRHTLGGAARAALLEGARDGVGAMTTLRGATSVSPMLTVNVRSRSAARWVGVTSPPEPMITTPAARSSTNPSMHAAAPVVTLSHSSTRAL